MSPMLSSDHLIPGTKIHLEDYTRLVLKSNKFDNNHAKTILGKRKEQLFEDSDKSAFRGGML
ncbi:6995_t:CDS:2 [Entrophospora sp. SA101]|nr:14556_t:CDS:2 [Entrophospora sp. SA101]CAJ0824132.1 13214_t:CDS:2 [Entrophospora sp. SA101]CAJ0845935.1 6995_t:CDS:2 [Entrophospora sp. SA101]